jgi:hypothetical protein
MDGMEPSASSGTTSAGDVDQGPSHHLRRHAEKVLAVLPLDAFPAEQAQTDFIDESRRLQADVRSLAGQIATRHAMQFVVHERHHPVEGLRISGAPRAEQLRDRAAIAGVG